LLFASAARRAILVSINPDWKPSEIDVVLSDSKPKLIVLDGVSEPQLPHTDIEISSLAELSLNGATPELPPLGVNSHRLEFDLADCEDDPVIIVYTSGTTSHGKG
jgi:long-subunit acyl-CoA synthetase (AMP-forming)